MIVHTYTGRLNQLGQKLLSSNSFLNKNLRELKMSNYKFKFNVPMVENLKLKTHSNIDHILPVVGKACWVVRSIDLGTHLGTLSRLGTCYKQYTSYPYELRSCLPLIPSFQTNLLLITNTWKISHSLLGIHMIPNTDITIREGSKLYVTCQSGHKTARFSWLINGQHVTSRSKISLFKYGESILRLNPHDFPKKTLSVECFVPPFAPKKIKVTKSRGM